MQNEPRHPYKTEPGGVLISICLGHSTAFVSSFCSVLPLRLLFYFEILIRKFIPAKSPFQCHSLKFTPAKFNFYRTYRIKNHQKKRDISPKFHAIAKVYTCSISERRHSRNIILAINCGPKRSRKLIPKEKVSTHENLLTLK